VIARLRGKPVASTPEGLLIDVGGVGYLVAATPSAVRKADGAEEVTVETYLHVREDAMQLYGFAERAERELFIQLLSVNGVGPKVALAIVSGSPAEELRRAIVREDAVQLLDLPLHRSDQGHIGASKRIVGTDVGVRGGDVCRCGDRGCGRQGERQAG